MVPLAGVVRGEPALPAKVMQVPGMRELLPPGTLAEAPLEGEAPFIALAAGIRPEGGGGPFRVAVVVLEPPPAIGTDPEDGVPHRPVRLVVAKWSGERLVTELTRKKTAFGAHSLELGRHGPKGEPVVAVHWAEDTASRRGLLQVWRLGGTGPVLALSEESEGAYFEPREGVPGDPLVTYPPEEESLVVLPRVKDWRGDRLVPSRGRFGALLKRLLAGYDEVLDSYRSSGAIGLPPLMVVDVALLRGRLFESVGARARARRAFELLDELVPEHPPEAAEERDDWIELRRRVDEARRRAASLAE